MKRGLTLIELLVSLTIFGIILAAILSIYFYQQRRATYVQETSIMQTDAQVAFELLKRDILHAGLGISKNNWPLTGVNGGANAPDEITLYGVAFFPELDEARWNPIVTLSRNGILICKNWSENERNVQVGDTVIILSPDRDLLYPGVHLEVQDVSVSGDRRIVTLNNPNITVNAGFVFRVIGNIYQTGVRYWLDQNNNILMRNNDIFLENVEDFQVAYGYDWDGDSLVEENEFRNDLSGLEPDSLYERPFMVRVSLVVRTEKGMAGFTYPRDTLRIEDRVLLVTRKTYERIILRGVVSPRNIRG